MGLFSGITKAVKSVVGGISDVLSPVSSLVSGFSGIGSIVAPFLSYEGQNSANATNIALQGAANQTSLEVAQKQMDFQERMSNTAYQRATADMEAAGLNPMLAYSQGGASSPSGASANIGAARVENALSGAVSSAMAAQRLKYEIDNMKETNKQIASQTALNESAASKQEVEKSKLASDMVVNAAIAQKANADTKLSSANAANVNEQTRITRANASQADVTKALFDAIAPDVNSAKDSFRKQGGIRDAIKSVMPGKPGDNVIDFPFFKLKRTN